MCGATDSHRESLGGVYLFEANAQSGTAESSATVDHLQRRFHLTQKRTPAPQVIRVHENVDAQSVRDDRPRA